MLDHNCSQVHLLLFMCFCSFTEKLLFFLHSHARRFHSVSTSKAHCQLIFLQLKSGTFKIQDRLFRSHSSHSKHSNAMTWSSWQWLQVGGFYWDAWQGAECSGTFRPGWEDSRWYALFATLLVKGIGNTNLSLNKTFNNKARDNAGWKEDVPRFFNCKLDSMEKRLHLVKGSNQPVSHQCRSFKHFHGLSFFKRWRIQS